MRTITWVHDCEGDCECDQEHIHELPTKRQICSRCDGDGRILNPAIGEHAYSTEDFEREFESDGEIDYRAEYFKGGRGIYGVICPACNGEKVVDVVDLETLKQQDPKLSTRYRTHLRKEAQYRRMVANEQLYGA